MAWRDKLIVSAETTNVAPFGNSLGWFVAYGEKCPDKERLVASVWE